MKGDKRQKSIEEYRRDIFVLKQRLRAQEEQLASLRQQYTDQDVFSDKSYSFSMKLKILQYNLADIRAKISKFSHEEAYEYYRLNFSVFAFAKSCQIIGITKEMVFRGIDIEGTGKINSFDLINFLRDVLRLDSDFITPVIRALGEEDQPITIERYQQFLASFLLKNQQNGEVDNLDEACYRIAKEILKEKIDPEELWTSKDVNIAIVTHGLKEKLKNADLLDCVAVYCKCDPLKAGTANSSAVIALLKQRMNDVTNFKNSGGKIKLSRKE